MSRSAPLSVRMAGEGTPLVMIHGWGMSGMAWRFQSPLSSRFRLLIPDLPGYSDSPPSDWSPPLLVQRIASTVNHLVEAPAVIVGWSLGSLLALRFARSFPEMTKGVVLVGGTARFTTTDGYDAGLPLKDIRGLRARLKRHYGETMGDFFRRMFVDDELDSDQYRKIVREIILPGRQPSPDVALKGLDFLGIEDLRSELPYIPFPVLIVHGLGDTITPPASARYLADNLPHAILQYLPGIGHAPFLSRPEEFNALITSFVDEVTS